VMSYLTRCLFFYRGTPYFLIATQRTTKRPESGIGERDSNEKERLSKKVSGIARKRSRIELQGRELCVCVCFVCRTITQPSLSVIHCFHFINKSNQPFSYPLKCLSYYLQIEGSQESLGRGLRRRNTSAQLTTTMVLHTFIMSYFTTKSYSAPLQKSIHDRTREDRRRDRQATLAWTGLGA